MRKLVLATLALAFLAQTSFAATAVVGKVIDEKTGKVALYNLSAADTKKIAAELKTTNAKSDSKQFEGRDSAILKIVERATGRNLKPFQTITLDKAEATEDSFATNGKTPNAKSAKASTTDKFATPKGKEACCRRPNWGWGGGCNNWGWNGGWGGGCVMSQFVFNPVFIQPIAQVVQTVIVPTFMVATNWGIAPIVNVAQPVATFGGATVIGTPGIANTAVAAGQQYSVFQ